MLTLKGENIYLRALEPEDLDFIYRIENDEHIWEMSATQTPYSKFLIKQYLEHAHKDIYEVKQLRLVICSKDEMVLGLIDLFDFDPMNNRAGVGILIAGKENRGHGYGTEALQLVVNYSFKHLHLHLLYANIASDNATSIKLFEKQGFNKVGVKKDWNLVGDVYKDEFLYQLIHVH
ncbi:N-acetyltransferase [Aquimarina sp. AD10]|uniref:Acetyltransferase n=1 Tax=Aquimarina aggregata TaxID=1642818 RepID=A0A163BVK3_9FLAO|nr:MULTISPECIES: GNAT family N-acetyltransferase [Aquimarina]AXT63477.1 N-acetyltransferase [Aquimarina sp. AD10]KZS41833.1 acetyltransferase [Aquimarina aggregata]RKM99805.1 N-acetyltransferase [Aquimarina sp. AD10]